MKIASITDDRRELVRALEEATGLPAKYLYAPSFNYVIGPYQIDRAGFITVEDSEVSEEVLSLLRARELIRQDTDTNEDATVTIISVSMEGHSGRSLKNLVFQIHSKSVLLGKAVGRPGLYRVSEELIMDLDQRTLGDVEEFLKMLADAGEEALQGFSIASDKICFFFPYTTDPARLEAFMQLVTFMVKAAKDHIRLLPEKCRATNEKFTFRTWLMRLGMMGDAYKVTRKILMQNLKGNCAHRTIDQKEAARKKEKEKREAKKKAAAELAFGKL